MILLLKYNHFLWKGCESHGLIFALHRITEWNWRPMALSGSFLWIKPSCMLFCCCSSITAKAENEKAFRLVLCVLKCYQIILSFNMPTKTKKCLFLKYQHLETKFWETWNPLVNQWKYYSKKYYGTMMTFFKKKNNNANNEKSANWSLKIARFGILLT